MDRIRFSVMALVLGFGLVSVVAQAQTRPYVKAFGADVFTGGWFNDGTNFCYPVLADNYQDPLNSGDSEDGGIVAFTKSNATSGNPEGGSSGQFGIFALGDIVGSEGSGDGFNSNGVSGGGNPSNYTSFANNDGGPMPFGGTFQGTTTQGHCIPDYYSTKGASTALISLPDLSSDQGKFVQTGSGSTPVVVNGALDTIPPGNILTLFIDGNAYIGANIEYSSAADVTHVPKFALVVRGSIYISSTVTRLDGLYIAQPKPESPPSSDPDPMDSDDGIIWTCHPNSATAFDGSQVTSQCDTKLTINGALIAKQVNLLRTNGNVSSPTVDAGEDQLDSEIAEVINYTPAMVVGGPFFNPSSSSTLRIQSLVNLPPVF